VLKREGLIDREFLADHCIGWDELEPPQNPKTPKL